jgi:hypothetical protein
MQIKVIRVRIQIRGTPTRGREMLHYGVTQKSNPIRRDFTKPHREILHHNNLVNKGTVVNVHHVRNVGSFIPEAIFLGSQCVTDAGNLDIS